MRAKPTINLCDDILTLIIELDYDVNVISSCLLVSKQFNKVTKQIINDVKDKYDSLRLYGKGSRIKNYRIFRQEIINKIKEGRRTKTFDMLEIKYLSSLKYLTYYSYIPKIYKPYKREFIHFFLKKMMKNKEHHIWKYFLEYCLYHAVKVHDCKLVKFFITDLTRTYFAFRSDDRLHYGADIIDRCKIACIIYNSQYIAFDLEYKDVYDLIKKERKHLYNLTKKRFKYNLFKRELVEIQPPDEDYYHGI